MTKSYSKDIQLLLKISENQHKIIKVIKDFGCTEKDLESNEYAFDLCALYMSQIGEASKYLTDETKQYFQYFDPSVTNYFRNMIDHVYEKVNKKYLKAYILGMIKQEAIKEVIERISFCKAHASDR